VKYKIVSWYYSRILKKNLIRLKVKQKTSIWKPKARKKETCQKTTLVAGKHCRKSNRGKKQRGHPELTVVAARQ